MHLSSLASSSVHLDQLSYAILVCAVAQNGHLDVYVDVVWIEHLTKM